MILILSGLLLQALHGHPGHLILEGTTTVDNNTTDGNSVDGRHKIQFVIKIMILSVDQRRNMIDYDNSSMLISRSYKVLPR